MEKTYIIMNALLPEPTSIGTTKTTFDFPVGTITQTTPPTEIAQDYTIDLNGVKYQCNFFENGNTKIKAAYRTEGHDTIAIEFVKADGSVKAYIRHDEIEFNVGDRIILSCVVEIGEIKTSLVRFNKNKAVYLKYDVVNDNVSMEVL